MVISSLYPHMMEGERELTGASYMRTLIPFLRALPSGANHCPKAPPQSIITLGIRFSTYEFQGQGVIQTFRPSQPYFMIRRILMINRILIRILRSKVRIYILIFVLRLETMERNLRAACLQLRERTSAFNMKSSLGISGSYIYCSREKLIYDKKWNIFCCYLGYNDKYLP